MVSAESCAISLVQCQKALSIKLQKPKMLLSDIAGFTVFVLGGFQWQTGLLS
jgi:hypothetical protein